MSDPNPTVRYLILCEDVQTDPSSVRRVTLVNLVSSIRSLAEPLYPVKHGELCVFVQMTECRGVGNCRVEIANADSARVVFWTRTRHLTFGNDPLEIFGLTFRIRNCTFPEPGLYLVQLWYNEHVLAQQPLVLR